MSRDWISTEMWVDLKSEQIGDSSVSSRELAFTVEIRASPFKDSEAFGQCLLSQASVSPSVIRGCCLSQRVAVKMMCT